MSQARSALLYLRRVLRETVQLAERDESWDAESLAQHTSKGVQALAVLDSYLTGKRVSSTQEEYLRGVWSSLIGLEQIDAPLYLSDDGYSRLFLALPVEPGQVAVSLSNVVQPSVKRRWSELVVA